MAGRRGVLEGRVGQTLSTKHEIQYKLKYPKIKIPKLSKSKDDTSNTSADGWGREVGGFGGREGRTRAGSPCDHGQDGRATNGCRMAEHILG